MRPPCPMLTLRSAARQRDFINNLVHGGLQVGEAMLWYDWAQGVSLPHAHLQTNTMFYGTARMQLALFGCVIMQRLASGVVKTKHY